MRVGLLLAGAALAVVGPALVGPAVAASAVDAEDLKNVEVVLREANLPFEATENHVTMDIVITDADTGAEPPERYGVFLTARDGDGEAIDDPQNCQEEHFKSPEIPEGVYRCSVVVDYPAAWTFRATVNLPTAQGQELIETVETTIDVDDALVLAGEDRGLRYVVEGSKFEVFLLQAHVVAAITWLLLAGAMAFLAVPRLRRMLSALALHAMEVRRGVLASGVWVSFGVTLITGTWLLNTRTAYEAPFSTSSFSLSAWDRITALPYAQTYFAALYVKILAFLVMGGASVLLMAEAARQSTAAQGAAPLDLDDDDDMWSRGVRFDEQGHVISGRARPGSRATPAPEDEADAAVAGQALGSVAGTAVAARRRSTSPAGLRARTLWTCVAVMLAGSGVITVAVTVLKYTHELIETAAAESILRGLLG